MVGEVFVSAEPSAHVRAPLLLLVLRWLLGLNDALLLTPSLRDGTRLFETKPSSPANPIRPPRKMLFKAF